MLLGHIIRELSDEAKATEVLLALGDLPLLARIVQAARASNAHVGAYAAAAVTRFADQAGDDDWLGLMTALERAEDPAVACLRSMIGWALRQDSSPDRVATSSTRMGAHPHV